jgi:hypothetical protein
MPQVYLAMRKKMRRCWPTTIASLSLPQLSDPKPPPLSLPFRLTPEQNRLPALLTLQRPSPPAGPFPLAQSQRAHRPSLQQRQSKAMRLQRRRRRRRSRWLRGRAIRATWHLPSLLLLLQDRYEPACKTFMVKSGQT